MRIVGNCLAVKEELKIAEGGGGGGRQGNGYKSKTMRQWTITLIGCDFWSSIYGFVQPQSLNDQRTDAALTSYLIKVPSHQHWTFPRPSIFPSLLIFSALDHATWNCRTRNEDDGYCFICPRAAAASRHYIRPSVHCLLFILAFCLQREITFLLSFLRFIAKDPFLHLIFLILNCNITCTSLAYSSRNSFNILRK